MNVHDLPLPHVIEVHSAQTVIKAGWLMDSLDFDNEQSAFSALARVVAEGDFMLVDERDFIVNINADTVQELQEWLAEWWETAILPEHTIQRVEDLLRQVGQPARIVLSVPTRMTKLIAVNYT